jgi:fructose-1,6-bisphosphatase/inositol monophosphatase family enzyme
VVDLLDELLAIATRVAAEAAALLLDGLDRPRTDVGTKTSSTDMVTEVDRASEQLIVTALRSARPDDALLGEEGTASAGTTGVRWVIDPLDGTTNYLYGMPGFAVSIAAEVDGTAAVGVVHDPLHGDVFTAVRGRGARRNGEVVHVRRTGALRDALVATGFAYDPERRRRQAAVLTQVLPQVRDIRRAGAAAVDLCSVACGRVDAYYERGLGPWDFAAGVLVAAEAGAVVGDLEGGPPSGEFVLAAPFGLFAPLQSLLAASGAADA